MTLHPIWNIRPRNSQDKDWVEVVKGAYGDCSSQIGRQQYWEKQSVTLGTWKQTGDFYEMLPGNLSLEIELNLKLCLGMFCLGGGCYQKSTIIHEFIHALGFYHEQNRPDRDDYITIIWDNIYEVQQYNFKRHYTSLTFNVPYDGKSIMHYRPRAWSKNGLNTIESKVKNNR